MEEAFPQGGEASEGITSAPLLAQGAATAFDVSTAVVADIQSTLTTWSSLLEKVKLFTDLVDKVAEVRYLNIIYTTEGAS